MQEGRLSDDQVHGQLARSWRPEEQVGLPSLVPQRGRTGVTSWVKRTRRSVPRAILPHHGSSDVERLVKRIIEDQRGGGREGRRKAMVGYNGFQNPLDRGVAVFEAVGENHVKFHQGYGLSDPDWLGNISTQSIATSCDGAVSRVAVSGVEEPFYGGRGGVGVGRRKRRKWRKTREGGGRRNLRVVDGAW